MRFIMRGLLSSYRCSSGVRSSAMWRSVVEWLVTDASKEISAFIFKRKSDQVIKQFFLDCFIHEDESTASRGSR